MFVFKILLIVFCVLLVMQLVRLGIYQRQKINSPVLAVACAGSEKYCTPKEFRITNLNTRNFKDKNGEYINSQDYERCIIVGNSMLLGGIRDKDIVFIKRDINIAECSFPVILVLRREPAAMEKASLQYDDKAELKVRRTWEICSLNQSDEEIAKMVEEIIKSKRFQEIREIDESKFATSEWMVEDIKCRITRYRTEHIGCEEVGNKNNVALLSTTYDTGQKRVHFSIHPVRTIVGEVKYAFGTNE